MLNNRRANTMRDNLDFKPSNIRIWIHNRDIKKLQQVLWEGHGSKLRCETSNNPRVKKFLEAAPFIMGTIKEVHSATIKNDISTFRKKLAEPVSPIILCAKDCNGLNVLHKAAGLGYSELAREILELNPAIVNATDNDGRTPLHYAAVFKDGGVLYDMLAEYGADESKLDNKMKAAAYYKNRPSDIDLTNLVTIPEAPRVGSTYPKHWDWRILEADELGTRGMRRAINNNGSDSAFGSAESTKEVMENGISLEEVIVGEHEEPPETELDDAGMLDDEEVEKHIENGNMEQLAALVLNGEGGRLIGRTSDNPDLQAFINNVPSYMVKIHEVHSAAKDGQLKDLQNALDRRKFAIAKHLESPHGATPLHVAVIFGHTPIIRYLAGRFPETAHTLDNDGRTALHYAATLADNGHYYNLLLHLGANSLIEDNFGRRADYYKLNHEDLSHKQLLRDFGAPESLADEMLVDKVPGGDTVSARRDITDPDTMATLERCFRLLAGTAPRRNSVTNTPGNADVPNTEKTIFPAEEGQYLANSLGTPLIEGLTEVANKRPRDPVTYLATYLYNFANKNKSRDTHRDANITIIPDKLRAKDVMDDDAGYPQSPDLEIPETNFGVTERDEYGQSILHFAANRSHSKDGLYHMLQEKQINVAFRDARYRTGRDIAELSEIRENVEEIDRYVVYLAARGETNKLVELLLEGYDHIIDANDAGTNIIQIAAEQGHESTIDFLNSINNFVERRDEIHQAIRSNNLEKVKDLFEKNGEGGKLLAIGKNSNGRCSLHIAVLEEREAIVRYIAKLYPETLRLGDNLQRTPLHYAMGVPSVEILSNILIKSGSKRIQKDLKSRQPSYYFMNKSEIQELQEEEKLIV